jgi:hypothetical protein
MKKAIKYGIIGVCLLVLILLVAPFIIPKHVYISFITDKVEQHYPVVLELQDASLRFLPSPRITLSQTSVKIVADKNSPAPSFTAKDIHITPNLLGLLEKDFVPRSIIVNNMTVALDSEKQKKEHYNINYLKFSEMAFENNALQSKVESKFSVPQIKDETITLVSHLKYVIEDKKLHINEAQLSLQDYKLQTKGSLDLSQEEPVIDLSGTTSAINVSQFSKEAKGQATLKYSAKGMLENLAGDMSVQSKKISYQNESLKIKEQPLKVTSKWQLSSRKLSLSQGALSLGPQEVQFDGTYPLAKALFKININIDNLQSKYLKTLVKDPQSIPKLTAAKLKSSYSSLGTAKGTFSSIKIKTLTDTYTNFSTDFSYKKDKLHLTNIKTGLYEGSLTGNATIPMASHSRDNVTFNIKLKNASLKKIQSLRKQFKGKASLSLKGECNPLIENWEKTLSADGNIKTLDVSLEDIDFLKDAFDKPVWNKISKIKQSKLNLKKLKKYVATHQDIENISSKFTIKNGSFHLAKSKIKMPNAHMTIKGLYGIDGRLKLKGDLVLKKSLLRQGIQNKTLLNAITEPHNRLTLPYTITGTMPKPSLQINEKAVLNHYKKALKEYAQDKSQKIIEKNLEKTKDKVIESIPKIQDKVMDLF